MSGFFKQAWQSVTGGQDEANGAVVATPPEPAAIDQAAKPDANGDLAAQPKAEVAPAAAAGVAPHVTATDPRRTFWRAAQSGWTAWLTTARPEVAVESAEPPRAGVLPCGCEDAGTAATGTCLIDARRHMWRIASRRASRGRSCGFCLSGRCGRQRPKARRSEASATRPSRPRPGSPRSDWRKTLRMRALAVLGS